jgi:nucleoside-diphosphate-sugar epimerase
MPPAKRSTAKATSTSKAKPKGVKPKAKTKAGAKPKPKPKLTVAVTGPTGEIGTSFVAALEREPKVGRIIGMARSPFDPAAHGWTKTEYRRGDILDRGAVDALTADADVVVHLAFIIVTGQGESRDINLIGSRNVFESAAAAGAKRLVYTSSVAAYGFSDEAPDILTEDTPARGFDRHPYSAQKAEVEAVLDEALDGSDTDAYVFRPCIVAGPEAPLLVESIPFVGFGQKLPSVVRALFDQVPVLKPVLPDPGVPFQLVHHDDVAAALVAAVLGTGEAGIYNLAGEGEITIGDLAEEIGWYSVSVPDLAVDATAEIVSRLPFLPDEAAWIEALRRPVLMDTSRARKVLGWKPQHDARSTLRETVAAHRADLEAVTQRGPVGEDY